MCLVTHESKPTNELIRFTLVDDKLVVDPLGKLGGRGYYISRDKETIEKAKEKNLLKKILKANVPTSFYDDLLNYL